jgi:hypothetical protein
MNEKNSQWDWRILLGTTLTALWISAGLIYLLAKVGWGDFVDLPTGDIGSFLEGAFAPLAFLWLVIGHFMQQSEISANTKAITLQEQSARRQEIHAQRNSYFQLLGLVQDQLGAIAGFHFMSVCGPTGTGDIDRDQFNSLRAESSSDHAVFIRKMVTLAADHREDEDAINEIFFGTEIRQRHSDNYVNTFKKLIKAAEAVDHDEMLTNALIYGSAAGMLYRVIRFLQGDETMNPISGIATRQAR